jgi:hypothetical protein
MKGVIMRAGPQKSIVLFNNGKFGTIPTPPNGETGMIVSVSYNKKAAVLLGLLCCAVLLCAMLAAGWLYFTPAGLLHLRYGEGETAALVELAYNRFSRIVDYRPLNAQAVSPLADIASIRHSPVPAAYERLIKTLSRSPALMAHTTARVRIAQDDLSRAKAIERDLSLRSESLMTAAGRRLSVTFELYTLELYRAASGENTQNSPPMQWDGHRHMMMNMWGHR